VLIIIPYQILIGFAIGRLISAFYEMAVRLTGDPARVHFSFTKVEGDRCTALPPTFKNTVEFNPSSASAGDVARLAAYIRENGITDVFGLDIDVNSSYLTAIRRAGVRKIISYWGAPMSSANGGIKLVAKRLEVALLRRTKPDHFIFESEAMRSLAINGRGLSAALTSIVHTGVNDREFRPVAAAKELVYERFGIPADRRIVVYMGHLHERKGVHVLMQAAAHIVGAMKRTDVHCLFLGDLPGEADRFRQFLQEAEGWITFGGYQTDIPALLAGVYAGCVPSNGWDSFPMSSLEMQACGLPVIVSDWQGVPETIANGVTGLAVPVGDAVQLAHAITWLVDNPTRRDEMSRSARQRIEAELTREHQISSLVKRVRAELNA
jgi:glycosyltransferase involved in cell wall biosynthesis